MTADVTTSAPEPAAAGSLPPGVLGYVVCRVTSKPSLTHSSVLDRETAEGEAAVWRRTGLSGVRVVVCEVREITAREGER